MTAATMFLNERDGEDEEEHGTWISFVSSSTAAVKFAQFGRERSWVCGALRVSS
jgi:hypothetical protein